MLRGSVVLKNSGTYINDFETQNKNKIYLNFSDLKIFINVIIFMM